MRGTIRVFGLDRGIAQQCVGYQTVVEYHVRIRPAVAVDQPLGRVFRGPQCVAQVLQNKKDNGNVNFFYNIRPGFATANGNSAFVKTPSPVLESVCNSRVYTYRGQTKRNPRTRCFVYETRRSNGKTLLQQYRRLLNSVTFNCFLSSALRWPLEDVVFETVINAYWYKIIGSS